MRQQACLLKPRTCLPIVYNLAKKLTTRLPSWARNRDVLPLAGNNAFHIVLLLALLLPATHLPGHLLDSPISQTSP